MYVNPVSYTHLDEFTMVSEASKKLESTFNVTFSDSDKATIIEIIINNKRRN